MYQMLHTHETSMRDLLERLDALLPQLSPQLQRAGAHVLDNPNAIAVLSMRALAGHAGVTPPTMLRLARRLGFESYEDFRAVFQRAVTGGEFFERARWLRELGERGGEGEVARRIAEAAGANVQTFYQHLDLRALVRIADKLASARTPYVVGAGALHWMAAYFQHVTRIALPRLRSPRADGNSLVEGLMAAGSRDAVLLMSVAPYASATLDVARLARERGATLFALTDSRAAPVAREASQTVLVSTESPQFFPSMVGVAAALETLIAVVVSRSDKSTLGRIAEADAFRRQSDAYL